MLLYKYLQCWMSPKYSISETTHCHQPQSQQIERRISSTVRWAISTSQWTRARNANTARATSERVALSIRMGAKIAKFNKEEKSLIMKTTDDKRKIRCDRMQLIAVSAWLAICVGKIVRSQPERVDLLRVIRIRFVQRSPMHPSAHSPTPAWVSVYMQKWCAMRQKAERNQCRGRDNKLNEWNRVQGERTERANRQIRNSMRKEKPNGRNTFVCVYIISFILPMRLAFVFSFLLIFIIWPAISLRFMFHRLSTLIESARMLA